MHKNIKSKLKSRKKVDNNLISKVSRVSRRNWPHPSMNIGSKVNSFNFLKLQISLFWGE